MPGRLNAWKISRIRMLEYTIYNSYKFYGVFYQMAVCADLTEKVNKNWLGLFWKTQVNIDNSLIGDK